MTTPDARPGKPGIITMYDSVTTALLPAGAARYAAYVNGKFANHAAVQTRFPHARVFGIDVLGTAWTQASILDWEPGDVQAAATLRDWVTRREAWRTHSATVYCDRDELDDVEKFLAGVWHQLWVSTLDGTDMTGERTSAGNLIVATQLRGGLEAPFDTSTALDSWG